MTFASSNKDVYWKLNSLASLACGLVGRYILVDLRNDATANGKLDIVNGFIDMTMSDVIFTDACGNEFYFEIFFVRGRNIRYIHMSKDTNDVILRSLDSIKNPRSMVVKSGAAGFKASRLIQRQIETLKRVQEIKKEKERKKKEVADAAGPSTSNS